MCKCRLTRALCRWTLFYQHFQSRWTQLLTVQPFFGCQRSCVYTLLPITLASALFLRIVFSGNWTVLCFKMLLSLSRSTIAANVILAALASAAVVLRMAARRKRRLPLKADDYAIVFALVSFLSVVPGNEVDCPVGLVIRPLHIWNLCRSHKPIRDSRTDNVSCAVLET